MIIIQQIGKIVYDYFNIEVNKKTRKPEEVKCRQIICYFSRLYTKLSYSEIGEYIKRDYSSVIHSENKAKDFIKIYKDYAKEVEDIDKKIKDINQ